MRLAFISIPPAGDITSWSGIPTFMIGAFRGLGAEVVDVSPLTPRFARLHYLRWVVRSRYLNRSERTELTADALRSYGRQVDAAVVSASPDAVVATSPFAIANANLSVPLFIWTDATLPLLLSYPEFRRLSRSAIQRGMAAEGRALHKTTRAFYASGWAADSAVSAYAVAPERVGVSPFGANLEEPPPHEVVLRTIGERSLNECRLCWIGADWERKRGDFAVEVGHDLVRRGIPTQMEMIGALPRHGRALPEWVIHHGFVNKRDPAGAMLFQTALAKSHFLLLPSLAECFGIAVAEANAFGVPAVAAAVDGLAEAVRPQVNGFTLPPTSSPAAYAERIACALADEAVYRRLAETSLVESEMRLNWDAAARIVLDDIERNLAGEPA